MIDQTKRIARDFCIVKSLDCGANLTHVAELFGLSYGRVREIWLTHLCDPTLLPAQYDGFRLGEVNRATPDQMREAWQDAKMVRMEANRLAWRVEQARKRLTREPPEGWPGAWPLPAGEPQLETPALN